MTSNDTLLWQELYEHESYDAYYTEWHKYYDRYPQSIKLEDAPQVPTVQFTDDAASKETRYIRRRCFNCHTTGPPSWRRSTLSPGKIVCNKCGLYERTHLRRRPLRFDELRGGGKSRKAPTTDTKSSKSTPVVVKSESGVGGHISVSGTASCDRGDCGSSQSHTPGFTSAFSSRAVSVPLLGTSQSPSVDSGLQAPVRLPDADLASLEWSRTPQDCFPAIYPGPSDNFRCGSLPLQCNAPFTSPPMPSQSLAPFISDALLLPDASPLQWLSPPSLLVDLSSS